LRGSATSGTLRHEGWQWKQRCSTAWPVRKKLTAAKASIQWLARHPNGRIGDLSRWAGLSNRQLQRRFTEAVGYGPKMFQSVLRFQRLLKLSSHADAAGNLAQLAAEAGYSDQPHMTREVRRFSGSAPTALLASAQSTLRLSSLLPPD
jgi:AraC-like DNA-binding protein